LSTQVFMHTLGGTAKAAAGINVSEDIFAGEARCLGACLVYVF